VADYSHCPAIFNPTIGTRIINDRAPRNTKFEDVNLPEDQIQRFGHKLLRIQNDFVEFLRVPQPQRLAG
jgi:hypothetical protein